MAPIEMAGDPYLNSTGGLTPLFHLKRDMDFHPQQETKSDSSVESPKEARDPCQSWRGTLSYRLNSR